ncbi:uncharacterized protein LOC128040498 [Gossypium raimondii]|uniref:uncharacterized protein LOC128040498 n=1 Tax=Gossypium raimondii TaxID=29730 RepID=UPI00227C436D|nr:uncharacterized protein LOC128040498 [Gossypium raimondii]
MDFVSGLPLTPTKKDSVWVIVDRLTKFAHFIPIRTDYSLQKLAKLYVFEIVRLHGVPILIISNRDLHFTSRFWNKLHKALGTMLNFSTVFHPQTDGQSERVYSRLLKTPSDRQKSYADLKRREIEYSMGDFVFLKRVGSVAYQLELPLELDRIHDVFHVLMLRHYRSNPTHIVPVKKIEVRPDLTFEEELVQILERDVKVLKRKSIPLVKVLWHNHSTEEAT